MFIQLSLVIIGLAAGCISGRCPPCNDGVFEVVPFHAMVVESLQDLRGGRKFRTTRDKELDLVTRVCPRVRDSSHLISSHSPGFSCPQPQLTIFCPFCRFEVGSFFSSVDQVPAIGTNAGLLSLCVPDCLTNYSWLMMSMAAERFS
ncbi:hypothetical protein MPTK1_3g19050 [Marchantia polymorpha subsp. ruderalis]|uniref:Secreted protein n=2 Tax=Marchantia polymorpha TaxID=3197 RepID=A0AAF6B2E3_MARPO|nr:hypothetical protein MARPO_0049s0127 [Marchantia polymorpha]BBN06177.1 hypothetical protein Mp_3g19050 [Marchantia polymorpha subsp. ruderalis]|eukprot:PTQ38860.1 hypothetical protein MARPO_0049s0127 [Marchantia polymorpha]